MFAMERNAQPVLLTLAQRIQLMHDLMSIVRRTGKHILGLKRQRVLNTVEVSNHQFTTVDAEGGSFIRSAIRKHLRSFRGSMIEEADISGGVIEAQTIAYPLLLCDVLEGSTNFRRRLESSIQRPILAGTSAIVLEGPRLAQIAATAFFDFATGTVFSSARGEMGSYLAFVNGRIRRRDALRRGGDAQLHVIVPGYSHGNVEARARVEKALHDDGMWTSGGSRSSAQDLLWVASKDYDGYVDLRALFPGTGKTGNRDEVLHPWDVGGILPLLDGLGYTTTDATGMSWQEHRLGTRFTLVVAPPPLAIQILSVIKKLPFVEPGPSSDEHPASIPLPPQKLG